MPSMTVSHLKLIKGNISKLEEVCHFFSVVFFKTRFGDTLQDGFIVVGLLPQFPKCYYHLLLS